MNKSKTVFVLSGDYPDIGKSEVIALEKLGKDGYSKTDRQLFVNKKIKITNKNSLKRYAYVKKVYRNDKLVYENKENFEARKAHKRPVLHPSSLHPKLARAMVNISGIRSGVVCDPFCGTGGILIEAGLMGFKTRGYDIEEKMIKGCKKNLEHFGIKNFALHAADATKTRLSGTIVTDLPYSRNTRKADLEILYYDFLANLKQNINKSKKRAVIGFPDFVDYKKIIRKANMKISKEFKYYLHKSLSKKIVVVENIKI